MADEETPNETNETPKIDEPTAEQPEPKRRRKRASGWDTPLVTPAAAGTPVAGTGVDVNSLLGNPALLSNPSVLAMIQQQQQQEMLQRQQLASSIQQQMKQLSQPMLTQTMIGQPSPTVAQTATPDASQALANAMAAAQSNPLAVALGQQQHSVNMQKGLEHRIYVGSLMYDLTETDIRGVFGAFGTITNVVMSHEPSTGKSKGYCFIEYESAVSAQQALQSMNGFMLAGRPIKVNKPTFANQQTTPAMPTMPTGGGNNAMMNLAAALGRPPSTAAALAAATAPSLTSTMPPMINTAAALAAAMPSTTTMNMPAVTMPPAIPPQMGTVPGLQPVMPSQVMPPNTSNNSFQILVSNIAPGINADTLRTIFEPFGTILECNVPPGATSGFLNYQQYQPAKDAVDQMDSFELLDQRLKVQWVGGQPPGPPAMPQTTTVPTPTASIDSATATQTSQETTSVPAAVPVVGGDEDNDESSTWRCTLLRNMVSVEETTDETLEEEIIEECSKFGTVVQAKIVVMDDNVRVFVLYSDHEGAKKAKMSLNTRFFGGRVISGVLYDHEVFLAGNYNL